ncbi:MAG: hypothetical protein IPH80_38515 [Myxococcales bacterium]|nr:hypothetical protein [Myxococcales bacterium]
MVAGLALAHDGRRLAVVEQDGATRVYDLTTGGAQLLASPGLSEVYHRAIGISPDGARVVWGEARGIGVVEVPGGAPRRIEGGAGEVRELVVAADGQTAFSIDTSGVVVRWDLRAGTAAELARRPGADSLRLAPDGRSLAFGASDDTIIVRGTAVDAPAPRVLVGHAGSINDLAFAPDGLTLASASTDSTARLWDLATGASLRTRPPRVRLRAGVHTRRPPAGHPSPGAAPGRSSSTASPRSGRAARLPRERH